MAINFLVNTYCMQMFVDMFIDTPAEDAWRQRRRRFGARTFCPNFGQKSIHIDQHWCLYESKKWVWLCGQGGCEHASVPAA